jgi:hypothetical protein
MFFENLSFISFDFARATYEPNKAKTDTNIFNHAKSLIKIHIAKYAYTKTKNNLKIGFFEKKDINYS